jgi:hypothetical protein
MVHCEYCGLILNNTFKCNNQNCYYNEIATINEAVFKKQNEKKREDQEILDQAKEFERREQNEKKREDQAILDQVKEFERREQNEKKRREDQEILDQIKEFEIREQNEKKREEQEILDQIKEFEIREQNEKNRREQNEKNRREQNEKNRREQNEKKREEQKEQKEQKYQKLRSGLVNIRESTLEAHCPCCNSKAHTYFTHRKSDNNEIRYQLCDYDDNPVCSTFLCVCDAGNYIMNALSSKKIEEMIQSNKRHLYFENLGIGIDFDNLCDYRQFLQKYNPNTQYKEGDQYPQHITNAGLQYLGYRYCKFKVMLNDGTPYTIEVDEN